MRRFFITGGAGFIGSAFVRLILEEIPDCELVNFDALTYAGNLDNLTDLDNPRYRFVRGDIADRDAVLAGLEAGTDAIINFAAESHVDRSITSAAEFLRTNIVGTQVLLDAARERGVRRFVQVSTDEVMGSLPEDENAFFTESSPFAPNSPYAASKASAEHLVRAAHHTFGLDTVITRCGNNYGPRQFPEKFLPLAISNALNDQSIPVYGDGLNVRDWIYVEDHCRGILLALEERPVRFRLQLRRAQRKAQHRRREVVTRCAWQTAFAFALRQGPPGSRSPLCYRSFLAESELGWKPKETWEEGLSKTIRWYQENTDWVSRTRSGAYREYYEQQYGAEVSAS